MKNLLIGLMLLVSWTALGAGALGPVQYRTNDLTLSPTNVIGSNVLAGTNMLATRGANGVITLNALMSSGILTNEQVGPIHLNGDSYTTNGLYLSAAGLVNSNAVGSVTLNGGNQTNTGTLGVGGAAVFGGGVTVSSNVGSGSVTFTNEGHAGIKGDLRVAGTVRVSTAGISGGGTVPFGYNNLGSIADLYAIGTIQARYSLLTSNLVATNTVTIGDTTAKDTTSPPLTVNTNGGVAVQVDAGGKLNLNAGLVVSSNLTGLVPNLAATNIGNVGISGSLKVLANIIATSGNVSASTISSGSTFTGGSGSYLGFLNQTLLRSLGVGMFDMENYAAGNFYLLVFGTNDVTGTNFAALRIVNSTNLAAVPAIKVTSQSGTPADLTVLGILSTDVPTNGVAPPASVTQPQGHFGYLSQHLTNLVVCSGATADYTNVAATAAYTLTYTNRFGASVSGGTLVNTVAGFYNVDAGVTIFADDADNTGDEVEAEVFVGEVGNEHLSAHDTCTLNEIHQMKIAGMVYLPAGSSLTLRLRNLSDTGSTLEVWRAYLRVTTP